MHIGKYACHILLITYMFLSLFLPSSGYLHKNTDKTQQTANCTSKTT